MSISYDFERDEWWEGVVPVADIEKSLVTDTERKVFHDCRAIALEVVDIRTRLSSALPLAKPLLRQQRNDREKQLRKYHWQVRLDVFYSLEEGDRALIPLSLWKQGEQQFKH